MQGWIDLAQLVSSAGGVKGAYEKLANKIGEPPQMPCAHQQNVLGQTLICLQQLLVCGSQGASRVRCTANCLLAAA